jgi:probable selenium-dependent hydroxylase accessory protein YqeC
LEGGRAGGLSVNSDQGLAITADVWTDDVVAVLVGEGKHLSHENGDNEGCVCRNHETQLFGRGLKSGDDPGERALVQNTVLGRDYRNLDPEPRLLLVRCPDNDKFGADLGHSRRNVLNERTAGEHGGSLVAAEPAASAAGEDNAGGFGAAGFGGRIGDVFRKIPPMDLTEAFGLPNHAIVAVVGGGGKTSLIFSLAREAIERGRSAMVATSTRFTRPDGTDDFQMVETTDSEAAPDVRNASWIRPLIVTTGDGTRGRLLGLEASTIDDLAGLGLGLIAVEADGSRGRHFKAPGDNEPIIPASTTDVVVSLGLDVLGGPLTEQFVHRPERVVSLAGGTIGEPITAALVALVLAHEDGGRKNIPPGARTHAMLSSRGDKREIEAGDNVAARLVYAGFTSAVVADPGTREVYGVVR